MCLWSFFYIIYGSPLTIIKYIYIAKSFYFVIIKLSISF